MQQINELFVNNIIYFTYIYDKNFIYTILKI